jgi:Flp pilus assembly protein TadG
VTTRGMVQRARSEGGQAIVEFVIVLPLMFVLVFLIAYAAVGFDRYLRVTDAARIGARAAAVARFNADPTLRDPCEAARSAATAAVDGLVIDVSCSPPVAQAGQPFSVKVTYGLNVTFPLLPSANFDIASSVKERIE